jgi:hypothetical protein
MVAGTAGIVGARLDGDFASVDAGVVCSEVSAGREGDFVCVDVGVDAAELHPAVRAMTATAARK